MPINAHSFDCLSFVVVFLAKFVGLASALPFLVFAKTNLAVFKMRVTG